jgi:alcohol dehydrogenase
VMMNNDYDIADMIGNDKIKNRGIPSILVPTTAGTGSEATQNAIVMIPEQESKAGVISGRLLPDCVILDHGLTLGLPPAITASTGMDALTHALECYISKKANPLSDTYALRAVSLIFNSIQKAYDNGRDLAARRDMLIGAYYGGMSIAASGTAAVHALAYPLGGRYRIPHGVSNAILLAYVMEFNMDVIEEKLKEAAVASGICGIGETQTKAAEMIIKDLHKLTRELEIPSSLRAFDIGEKDIDELAEAALKVKRLLDNNPKEMKKEDMIDIYRKII